MEGGGVVAEAGPAAGRVFCPGDAAWQTSACMNLSSLEQSSSSPHLAFFVVSFLMLLAIAAASFILYAKVAAASGRSSHAGGQKNVPPGSLGLPLGLGETLQFILCKTHPIGTPPPFLSSRLLKYGLVFKTHLIGCPTVVSMDPDLNRFLLCNEEKLVQVNFPSCIKKMLGPMISFRGAQHKRFRELTFSILTPAAIQAHHLAPLQELARSILGCWLDMPVVDAQYESKKFIFTFIANALVSLAPEDPKTKLLMKEYLLFMTGHSAVPLNIPGTTYSKVLKARERILTMLRTLLQSRKEVARVDQRNDFLDVVMAEMDENGNPFTDQYIVDSIFSMVVAGFETSAVFLTNVIKYLSENAHVVEELRKEHTFIRRNKKANEGFVWEDFKQMEFTDFVIKETLRIATVAHYVFRETLQDVVFKDMVIPKGWVVLMNFSMVHLNPAHYKDPLKFDPWRWQGIEKNNHAFYMPFGGGIKSCPGAVLAKLEATIFIHYFVTTYRWDRLNKAEGQLDVVSSLSLPNMEKGLFIKVEPLNTNSV